MHLTKVKSDAKTFNILFNVHSTHTMPVQAVRISHCNRFIVRLIETDSCTVKVFVVIFYLNPKRTIVGILKRGAVQLLANLVCHLLTVVRPITFPFLSAFVAIRIPNFN